MWGSVIWAAQAPAQPSTQKPAAAPAAKPPTAKPAATAKPTPTPSPSAKATPTPPGAAAKRPSAAVKKAAAKQPVPTPKKEKKETKVKEQKAGPVVAGRRDPFEVPVISAELGGPGGPGEALGPPPPGIRGLIIGQLQLEGIARLDTTNAMIAVVTNPRKRAYFLRENDPVYNGVVSKITPEAVYFKENHLDPEGKVVAMEVVKRLNPVAGEGK